MTLERHSQTLVMFVKQNMQSRREYAKQKFSINTVQLTMSNSKKVKVVTMLLIWTRRFELIAQPATLSARYAVYSAQIRFGDLAACSTVPALSSHLYLPCKFKFVVCT